MTPGASARARNQAYWDRVSGEYQSDHTGDLQQRPDAWGVWRIPERKVRALGPVKDRNVLELGCGGGQWSLALAQRGARVVGLDVSLAQLRHAGALAGAGAFPRVLADAGAIPLASSSLDIVLSDHGAFTFADPEEVVPEVGRVLRAGGRVAFCVASPLRTACSDDEWAVGEHLVRPMFGSRVLDDGDVVEFNLRHGEWVALLLRHGLSVVALHELAAPARGTTTYPWFVSREWARRWPAEDLWVAEKRA